MTTPQLVEDLKRDEGLRLRAYPDPETGADPWTIGYGHTGREVHPGLVWTQIQAEAALNVDIAATERGLNTALPWWEHLDDIRQDAVANWAFNAGLHGVLEFQDTLAALKAGNWTLAASNLLNSKAARELPQRYSRLARMIATGRRP